MAVDSITVVDSSNITVATVGTQGLAGPATILGRSVAPSVTAGSNDDGALLVYDHSNTRWNTTQNFSSAIQVTGMTITGSGITTTPNLRVATIAYSDGDTAMTIADGGAVTIPSLVVTTADINGGDIASSVTVNKSPVITLAGDLSGNCTLTNLGNATLTATVTADATT